MCNPIGSKKLEQNEIKEASLQQSQLLQEGQRIENEQVTATDLSEMTFENTASVAGVSEPEEKIANKSDNETGNGVALDSIREYDVLMGRGSGPNRHSGNIHFRAIVGEVFDEFLSKHGSDRTMAGDSGSDMLRIDPTTKNRLAQAVLDKITIEKKGRFLQKLNKKELSEAIAKGEDRDLIKAKALSLMDTAMANSVIPEKSSEKTNGDEQAEAPTFVGGFNPNAVVYYRIIPDKQILAKIKQTFRFLRDQNEASNAEKHRQRARRDAAASISGSGIPRDQMAAAALGGVRGMHLPTGLASGVTNANAMAATYALMGANGLNINPSAISGLNNIIAPTQAINMSAIKNLNQSNPQIGATDLTSRLLSDLPPPNHILSTSGLGSTASLLPNSTLAAASSQLDASNISGKDNSTKRLLEELTLSRLANLQKQREETISAFLAIERSSSATSAPTGIINPVPSLNVASISPSTIPAQQLQRLLNLNSAGPAALPMAAATNSAAFGSLQSATPESLSLLLQLNNSSNSGAPGNHPLRAYNSTSF